MSDEKTCPMCAEAVKAAAVKCKHCGYDFVGKVMPAAPPTAAPAGKSASDSCIGVIIAGALILTLGYCMTGGGDEKTGVADVATRDDLRASATKVSARELFRAYQANEASAQTQYGDQVLEVSGTVQSIDLDLVDDPVVRLETDNQYMSAMADLIDADKPRAANLIKGQQVTLLCEGVAEVIGSPSLRKCAIVN